MKILQSSFWSFLSVGVRSIVIFSINKFFAITYGPQGITMLSHFQNLFSIFLTVPNDGVNKGVIKYIADATLEKKSEYLIIRAGLALNLGIFLLCVTGLFILRPFFENPFNGTNGVWLLFAVVLALFQMLNLLGLSIVLAKEKLYLFIALQVAGNVASLLLVFIMVQMASFQEALLAWAMGPALVFFATIAIISRHLNLNLRSFMYWPEKTYLKKLVNFILMALSIVICAKAVDFFIRQYAIENFDKVSTGYWQSVVRLSDLYLMSFTAVLSMVYYPKVSALVNSKTALSKVVRQFFWGTAGAAIPFLWLISIFGTQLLALFFDKGFKQAVEFLPFQLVGDYLKMTSWVLSFLLLAQARTALFIISQIVFAIIFVILIYLSSQNLGVAGFPVAYAIKNGLYLVFMLFIYRDFLSNQFSKSSNNI